MIQRHLCLLCTFCVKLHLISAVVVRGFSCLHQLLFGATVRYIPSASLRQALGTPGLCDGVSEANSSKLRCRSTCQVLPVCD